MLKPKPGRTPRRKAGTKTERELILRLFDDAFNKPAWHGPNLLGSIRRVQAKIAVRKARHLRHSIAEITVHCAYWKYALRRRLRGEKRGSFAIKGSNWFELSSRLTETQWRSYKSLLKAEHEALREALVSMSWKAMVDRFPNESKFVEHAFGVALHDTYHAGQIQTIKSALKTGA